MWEDWVAWDVPLRTPTDVRTAEGVTLGPESQDLARSLQIFDAGETDGTIRGAWLDSSVVDGPRATFRLTVYEAHGRVSKLRKQLLAQSHEPITGVGGTVLYSDAAPVSIPAGPAVIETATVEPAEGGPVVQILRGTVFSQAARQVVTMDFETVYSADFENLAEAAVAMFETLEWVTT